MGESHEYSQLWRLAVVCDELSSEQASGASYSKPNDDHEPRMTSSGRVKRIVTMSSSFASEDIPPTFTSSYRADPLISLKVEQAVGDKRSAPDTPDDGSCEGRNKRAGAPGPKFEQAEMRNETLREDGEASNLSREERKIMAIVRRIEEMEHKEKAAQGPRGVGAGATGEKLENEGGKEAPHKQRDFKGKGKEGAVEQKKRPVSEEGNMARKQSGEGVGGEGEGVGGEGAGASPLKKKQKRTLCPHNRQRSRCVQCGGSSICEHNRMRSRCKLCGGSSICEHNRRRDLCKECGGSGICKHNRQRSRCKQCGGSSICAHNRVRTGCGQCGGSNICEHNRQKSRCVQCGGSSICEHNRRRCQCKPCGGSSICEHNRRKIKCKDCLQKAL
jgi:hypothetical protein